MSSDPDFPAFEPEPQPDSDEDWAPTPAEMANDGPSAVAIAMDGAPSEVIERVGFTALLDEANATADDSGRSLARSYHQRDTLVTCVCPPKSIEFPLPV